MDYQTQQFRLLPYLASSYALVTTGVSMMMMFVQVMGQIDEGNLESLPEVRGQEDSHNGMVSLQRSSFREIPTIVQTFVAR